MAFGMSSVQRLTTRAALIEDSVFDLMVERTSVR